MGQGILFTCLTLCLGTLPVADSLAFQQASEKRWPHSREKGSYQARVAGTDNVLWNVSWETQVTEQDGKTWVRIQEQGKGTPWRYKEPIRWEKQMLFSSEPLLRIQSVSGCRWTAAGKIYSDMELRLEPAGDRLFYRDAEAGQNPQTRSLPWTSQTLPDELLFHWARALPFNQPDSSGKREEDLLLLVSPSRLFRVRARVGGTEQVTTPAGTFSCYRVDLAPKLFGPLKILAPKMALWCAAKSPHYWVKYQGPIGGPGSPTAVIELVEFKEEER